MKCSSSQLKAHDTAVITALQKDKRKTFHIEDHKFFRYLLLWKLIEKTCNTFTTTCIVATLSVWRKFMIPSFKLLPYLQLHHGTVFASRQHIIMEYVEKADRLHNPIPQNISDNSFCALILFSFSYFCSLLYFKEQYTTQKCSNSLSSVMLSSRQRRISIEAHRKKLFLVKSIHPQLPIH